MYDPPAPMPGDIDHPEQPRTLGEYMIVRTLGQGGMGVVYEAEERLSRRRVALKVLRGELGQTERGRQQFVREMAILANLDDPHIVRCLHCAEIEGQLVMVLEHLDGHTLRQLLEARGRFGWAEVVRIAWQIAVALQTAHAHDPPIVHRDLKPENVMVLTDGRVKVMDFGIAKVLRDMVGPTSSYPVGTLQYMSPEHIDAQPIDARADLYALGLVMWELLVGHPPFWADSPRVLLDKLCTEPPPPLPPEVRATLPHGLEALILRMLEKHPDARPRNATEVLAALERMQAPAPPVVASSSMPAAAASLGERVPLQLDTASLVTQVEQAPARRSALVPALVVGLIAMTGVATWAVVGGRSPASPTEATRAAQPKSASQPASAPASAPTEARDDACLVVAPQWQGRWELDTLATEAIKSSWVGGRSTYSLELKVDGCELSATGSRFKRRGGNPTWSFVATGSVDADGNAQIHYQANGRNIAGSWVISGAGAGTWKSDADDVSGTLTARRIGEL